MGTVIVSIDTIRNYWIPNRHNGMFGMHGYTDGTTITDSVNVFALNQLKYSLS